MHSHPSPHGEDDGPRSRGAKRVRVSVACVECRRKKERCDGIQPICSTCQRQNRHCYYTPREKKRGLPTGYVRSLEILFGLLFHAVPVTEQSVIELLRGELKVPPSEGLESNSTVGFFANTWRQSTACKDLERILVFAELKEGESVSEKLDSVITGLLHIASVDHTTNGPSKPEPEPPQQLVVPELRLNTSINDSEDMLAQCIAPTIQDTEAPLLKNQLPSNWHTLVDTYYSSVHCWFPIIPKQDILRCAHGLCSASSGDVSVIIKLCYLSHFCFLNRILLIIPLAIFRDIFRGTFSWKFDTEVSCRVYLKFLRYISQECSPYSQIASLWAVLAFGSYQSCIAPTYPESPATPSQYQGLLRQSLTLSMAPDSAAEIGHIRALLLSSLLCLGGDCLSQAWLAIGRAVYMTIDMGLTKTQDGCGLSILNDKLERIVLGSFILDTVVSFRLGRRPHLRTADLHNIALTNLDGIEEWESWNRLGLADISTTPIPARVLSCFSSWAEVMAKLNDFAHLPDDTFTDQYVGHIIQEISALAMSSLSNITSSTAPAPTPQSLNLLVAGASICRALWNRRSTCNLSRGHGSRLTDSSADLPGLAFPKAFIQKIKHHDINFVSPMYNIYLHISGLGPPEDTSTHGTEKQRAAFHAILDLLKNPPNCDNTNTANNPPAISVGTDLYDSLLSLDEVHW